MWNSVLDARHGQHQDDSQVVQGPDFEGHTVGVYESPILPQGSAVRMAIDPYITPTTVYGGGFSQHTHSLSRKSTFSTLPEVAPSPNPSTSNTVSPIFVHNKGYDSNGSPIAGWDVPVTARSDLEAATGTLDTEKEMYVGSDPTIKPGLEPGGDASGARAAIWKGWGKMLRDDRDTGADNKQDASASAAVVPAVAAAMGGIGAGVGTGVPRATGDARGKKGRTICGMTRKRFLILLFCVFVIVAAVAIGVSVGISKSNNSSESATSSDMTTPSTTTATPAATSTNSLSPAPTGTVTADSLECPSANRAEYTAREFVNATTLDGAGTKLVVLCNIDYSALNGTSDLSTGVVQDAAECFDWCASTPKCVGASFGWYGDVWRCWLKSKLGDPAPLDDWYSAIIER